MIKEITMPAGGQTTDTSTVGAWQVKVGDKVKRGDVLLEIETDKATLAVESYAKGTVLAILVEEGDTASAGDVIAYIGDESDKAEVQARLGGTPAAEVAPKQEEQKAASCKADTAEEEEYQPIDKSAPTRYVGEDVKEEVVKGASGKIFCPEDIKAMPNAKLLAKQENISLQDVAEFAGKDILKRQDVKNYIANGKNSVRADSSDSADTKVALTQMRKVIARRMLESSQNIPTFQATVEVNMEQCIALRGLVNHGKDDIKISYNDILFKCIEAALRKYPYVNASYTDDAIILHKDVNIGLAVSVENGLVVPVVKKVNEKNIAEISAVNKENIGKARGGKLGADDMAGGTITLSNLGMYPIKQFNAIINPPEVCILAFGATEDKPVLINGEWKAVPTASITGSFDHRVVDGAYGAQFLAELKKIIENPTLALM